MVIKRKLENETPTRATSRRTLLLGGINPLHDPFFKKNNKKTPRLRFKGSSGAALVDSTQTKQFEFKISRRPESSLRVSLGGGGGGSRMRFWSRALDTHN